MKDIKLKSCPFCDSIPELSERYDVLGYTKDNEPIEKLGYCVECVNDDCPCWVSGKIYYTKQEAANAWNTRKPVEKALKIIQGVIDVIESELN